MATAMNCTVKVYRGVPLVKGGTEVLYLSGGSAEGVLGGYAIRTYTNYYYTREDEGKIQVDDDIINLEGANYVGFQNLSHGGKWYFGFIDHLRYINDSTTEIHFTIDPFTTFVGDCVEGDFCYVIRNTVKTDTRGMWLTDDYLPKVSKSRWATGNSATVFLANCNTPILYFVCKDTIGTYLTAGNVSTGVQVLVGATQTDINDILEKSGLILGCYLVPSYWASTPICVADFGTTLVTSINNVGTFTHNKVKTGVYNKVSLKTTQATKYYEVEDFADPTSIQFKVLKLMIPSPALHIYPVNYRGMAHNLSEGLTMQCPSIPVVTPSVYTQGQAVTDIFATIGGALGGAVSGAALGSVGGFGGAGVGALIGAIGGVGNMVKNIAMTSFQTPSVTSSSFPMLDDDYNLKANLDIVSPPADVLKQVDDYFGYFGYQIDYEMMKVDVNTDDGAFLQIGSPWLAGSEADDEINARMMNGIKILKTL